MSVCSKCSANKLVDIRGKVVDRFWAKSHETGNVYEGYVPGDIGLGSGDYLRFTVCLRCGQIQNWKPKSSSSISGIRYWRILYRISGMADNTHEAIVIGDYNFYSEVEFAQLLEEKHQITLAEAYISYTEILYVD